MSDKKTIGIVGARGFTGETLIGLLADHEHFELDFVSSRKLEGRLVEECVDEFRGELRYEVLTADDVAERGPDVCVLALPNGLSSTYVEAIDRHCPTTVIVDLSSDHRFDESWTYGQTERFRAEVTEAKRIANPGCYATGMQIGLWPLIEWCAGPPRVFGVSGYSGAGTKPSPKNDLDLLRDNLLPYSLIGHTHEREVTHHLGRPIYFTPHVAPFFSGITLTISVPFDRTLSVDDLGDRFAEYYGDEELIEVVDKPPLVKDNRGEHFVRVGGFSVDDGSRGSPQSRAALVVTLDNLLKGAATQALQNANLACGFDELEGIR